MCIPVKKLVCWIKKYIFSKLQNSPSLLCLQSLTQNKLKAFSLGRTIPVKKANPFMRQREEREEKKRVSTHID